MLRCIGQLPQTLTCYSCNRYGHYSNDCPLGASYSGSKQQPTFLTTKKPSHSHILLHPNPRVIFVSQQRLIHSSAQSSTSQEFVISHVPQMPTAVIALDVGDSTLVSNAPSSQSTDMPHQKPPTNLFMPIPNKLTSSVNVERLRSELQGYADQSIADYLINGFRFGFDIGYTGPRFPWVSKNLVSSISNSLAVSQAIQKELSHGHIAGPFKEPPSPTCIVPP